MTTTNEHGQPVGLPLGDWAPPEFPPTRVLEGNHVVLEPLDPKRHGPSLFPYFAGVPDSLWTYTSFGPFNESAEFQATLERLVGYPDRLPYAVIVDGEPLGFAAYLRIQPEAGVIEIGSITYSPPLQETTAATEALYLFIRNAFALGYRRSEWKCDSLHEKSRAAAVRLGFTFEGIFRQDRHYKNRNRDTAWYAITNGEWTAIEEGFKRWLAADNFDEDGRQRRSLRQMRERD